MTAENISWSISTKECCRPWWGLNPRPPGLQSDGASNWATEAGPVKEIRNNCIKSKIYPKWYGINVQHFSTFTVPYSFPKYWDDPTPYQTCPKIWTSIWLIANVSKTAWCSSKQCRPWSDDTFCDKQYHIYPKYRNKPTLYHTCPKIWTSPFYLLLICLKLLSVAINSVDPDQMMLNVESNLDLQYFLRLVWSNT